MLCAFSFLTYVPSLSSSNEDSVIFVQTAYASHCTSGEVHNPNLDPRFSITQPCVTLAAAEQLRSEKANVALSTWEWFTTGAFLISITGMLLAFAGWLLNGSVTFFILKMGEHLGSDSAIGQSILTSWALIRDIINLTFVFGLIYLAFMTIAKADTQKLKHGVAQIVVAALLINFSLFFAKAIIDIANVTAIEIYSSMQTTMSQSRAATLNDGISGFFMERLGLSQFINANDVVTAGNNQSNFGFAVDGETSFGFSLMVSLVLIIASFVFFAGAILIAIRFVVLAMLLILSPVAFAGAFLPKINTEEWSRMWWQKLVSQAMFAPAYFLLLLVSMKATKFPSFEASAQGGGMVDFMAGKGDSSTIGAMLNFVIIIGFLVGSLIIAKKMGAVGASTVNAWGTSIAKGAGSVLGRNTIGWAANRGVKGYDSATSKAPTWVRKGLYMTGLHDATRGALDKARNAKFGGKHSHVSYEHGWEELEKSAGNQQAKQARVNAIKEFAKDKTQANRIEMEKQLKNASVKELEDLGHDTLHDDAVIGALTHSQVEGLMKSDHLDSTFKAHLAVARQSEITRRLTEDAQGNPTVALTEGIKKANTQQLKALGAEMLTQGTQLDPELAAALSSSQMDDLKKEFTETEFALLKTAREAQLQTQFAHDATAFFVGRKEKDIAKMPKDILKHVNATPHLTGEVLRRILEDNDLNIADRTTILTNITAVGTVPGTGAMAFLNSPRGANFA